MANIWAFIQVTPTVFGGRADTAAAEMNAAVEATITA
jgi:hypothetical protein